MIADLLTSLSNAIKLNETPGNKKQVVLFSEGNNHWVYLKPVVDYLLEHNNSISSVYLTEQRDDVGLAYLQGGMPGFYLGSGRVRDFSLNTIKCKIFMTSSPDLDNFQVKRSPHCEHYAYLQHSLNSLGMAYRHRAFNAFDTVFCAGEHHVRELRAICNYFGLGQKNIYNMRYEPVALLKDHHPRAHSSPSAQTILIAPTWGPTSLVEGGHAAQIIADLLTAQKRVILRPHPETVKHKGNLLSELVSNFQPNGFFQYQPEVEQLNQLIEADVMITDWSGAAFDFSLGLGKPVLFVNTHPKINNPDHEALGFAPIEVRCRQFLGVSMDPSQPVIEVMESIQPGQFQPVTTFERFYDDDPNVTLDSFFDDHLH